MSRDVARDWPRYHAIHRPDQLALVDHASGRRFTYAQFDERVGRLAGYLTSLGVARGERVGYLMLNSTDVMEIVFACWRIGAIALALNWRLTPDELEYIVSDASPSAVIYDDECAALFEELQNRTDVAHWIRSDGKGGQSAYEGGLAAAEAIEDIIEQPLSDQCLLMYSSGTTGKPKGVIITHEMMLYSAINLVHAANFGPDTNALAVMPLFHMGGLVVTCPPVYLGGCSVIMREFEPGAALAAFDGDDPVITLFLGVPAIYNALKMHPENASTDFSRVDYAIAGAEAVPQSLVKWWLERGLVVTEGYGMTESAASNLLMPKQDVGRVWGSAGRPTYHGELKIMREDGGEADPDEIGEIWMRGPVVTPGYWNRPDANEESFVDGWFRSGDVGKVDEDGFYYIEDRVKDMYISGGENVYPAEVENVLYEIDAIAEVAVIGVPDAQWGETGCAVAAVKAGATLSHADLIAHCKGRLARFKQPAHLHIVEALPRNATGKVLKFELRKSVPSALGLADADIV